MSREHGLMEEYKNNGLQGVVKRVAYYLPNHYIINKVKTTQLTYGLNKAEKREKQIIISLTSYPARFENIHLGLKSLLMQTVKPDKIILWFGSDTKTNDLTQKMLELEQYGIEYRFDKCNNIKPHKKYYYAMQEFPNDIIITVDDDVVYPPKTIESLMKSYARHPNAVSARRVHKITFTKDGKVAPYGKWLKEYRKEKHESMALMAVGVGGILYPPSCLDKRAFDINKIQELCIGADDIWLKCMEVLKNTKVVWVPCFFAHPPALAITDSLWQGNVTEDRNDFFLKKTFEHYGAEIERK